MKKAIFSILLFISSFLNGQPVVNSMLSLLKKPHPYGKAAIVVSYHPGQATGGGVFVCVPRLPTLKIELINVFPASGGDSCWVNVTDSLKGYNPLNAGALMNATARLNDFKYTAEDIQLLYGYSVSGNTLCDEVAIQHCAKMQQKTKSQIVFSSGDYYFEHRLDMPKAVDAGINQYYWEGYGAKLHFIDCDGMYRMPATIKDSQNKEALNSTIIKGFEFVMNWHNAIKLGGGFLCLVEHCLFDKPDTAVIFLHCMSSVMRANNVKFYNYGLYWGNLADQLPGALSMGGSNGGTAEDNHFFPKPTGSIASILFVGSSDCIARNTSQDGGGKRTVKYIIYIDTKGMSVNKGNFVDIVHAEVDIDPLGAVVYAAGGGAALFNVSKLYVQVATKGAVVWCEGGKNGSIMICDNFVYTSNRNMKSTGSVKWKINNCWGAKQTINWMLETPLKSNLVQVFK